MATRSTQRPDGKAAAQPQNRTGMTDAETRYMRGDKQPTAGSIPFSTSPYLNSPLFVHAFSRMALRRHGDDVATTYDIPDMSRGLADVIDYQSALEGVEQEKANNPAFRDFLTRRPLTTYNPDEMGHYARGTLGAEIRDFMRKTGYDLHFVNQESAVKHDIDYLRRRMGDCHDIQHMVTGFGPNSAGENALALMNITSNALHFNPHLAQHLSLPNIFVTSASYARIGFNYPAGMALQLEAMERGIAAGRAIKIPLIMVEWEHYLDWRLDDIATDLGFERGPGDAWNISEQLSRG
jgi:ubiquinone biosynthesis protein COQ4